MVREVREYLSSNSASPFARWRSTLDPQVRARIDAVIERFVDENFGDCKGLGDGVQEARVLPAPATGSTTGLMVRCW